LDDGLDELDQVVPISSLDVDVDATDGASISVRPFADLPTLPRDLDEAFEGCKLAILRHKISGWLETSPRDVLSHLDALRQLVEAPSEP
jgi:hypothetical protein